MSVVDRLTAQFASSTVEEQKSESKAQLASSDVDQTSELTSKFASTTFEEQKSDKEVSFVGLGLKLDTEKDAAVIVEAIQNCPGMVTMRLEGNTVGVPAAKAIATALETQSDFKNVLWKDMFTRRDKTEIPQALRYLSDGIMLANAKLVVLDLSDNAFGPRGLVGIQKLLESPCCYTLQELYLNNNGLGISGAQLLSESICTCIANSQKEGTPLKLKTFVCGRNRLENDGAVSVSRFLKQIGTLESITIIQNGIYHPGIKELAAAFSANPNLKALNLEDNSLTEKGSQHIADCLPMLQNLQVLNLGDCLVRTKGALAIAAAIEESCPLLSELYLGYNEIRFEGGEAIVDAMMNKKELKVLVLNGNSFGENGCTIITKKLQDMGKIAQFGPLSEDEGENEEEDEEDHYDDEENQNEEENQDDEDSEDEANQGHKSPNQSIHKSPMSKYQSPMTKISVEEFMTNPTALGLTSLYKNNENFSSLLPETPTINDYLEIFLKISLVVPIDGDDAKIAACKYADDFLKKAFELGSDDEANFNNYFAVCIGMIKDEDRKTKAGLDISGTLLVLEHAVRQSYFFESTRKLLEFFLSAPFRYVVAAGKVKHLLNQTLYQM